MSPDGFEVQHKAIHIRYAHLQRQMCDIQEIQGIIVMWILADSMQLIVWRAITYA